MSSSRSRIACSVLFAGLSLAGSTGASAGSFDITSLQNLGQTQFHDLAQDLGAALSYKPLEPADNLGVGGFDIGVVVSGTSIANASAVQPAINNSASVFNTLPVPTLRVTLGLPHNLDFGAEYSRVPSSPMNLWGANLKWTFLPGTVATPALALRASVTRLDGVAQMGFETIGADLSVSKGFLNFTPYGGIGAVTSRTSPSSVNGVGGVALQQVNMVQSKLFAGLGINLGIADVTVEADSTGGIHTYSAKLGFRF